MTENGRSHRDGQLGMSLSCPSSAGKSLGHGVERPGGRHTWMIETHAVGYGQQGWQSSGQGMDTEKQRIKK